MVESFQQSIVGVEFAMPPFISSDLQMEWKTFRRYITSLLKEDMNDQLKELSTCPMLETRCPSLGILAKVCLTLPVGTASVERSFLQMKKIKKSESPGRCQSFSSGEVNLSHRMKIAIESPQTLSHHEKNKQIVDVGLESQEEELLLNVNFYCCIDLLII